MTSQHKSALMRLSILSLLMAFFSALFLAPINARRDARSDARRDARSDARSDDFSRPFLPAYQGLPEPTEIKFLPSDGASGDYFGQAVSISGDLAVIGAPYDDDNGNNSGSAYIYRWNGSSWQEEAKLTPSDGASGDNFGSSVSIHDQVLIIGARYDDDNGSDSGSAYIFRFDGTTWQEEAKLLANDGAAGDNFGTAVSIGDDVALVGADYDDDNGSDSGSAYIFRFDGTTWQQQSKLTASDGTIHDYFGASVSLDSERVIIGAYGDRNYTGSAYIFRFDGSDWQEEAKLTASDGASGDYFGTSVSLDGERAIIGASADDDHGSQSGSAYIYRFDGSDWQEEAKLTAHDGAWGDYFGTSVSLEGDVALIGAYLDNNNGSQSGSAYIYRFDGTNWQESAKVTAGDGAQDDYFGSSVSLSGEMALVGAPQDDDNLLGQDVGAAYLYNLSPGNVPDITLSPSSMESTVLEGGSSTTDTLTIFNTGTEPLTWNINTPLAPWLTVSPLSGTLAADEEGLITLEFDPLALPIGHYTETLTISSNDPDEAELTVPLRFKVMRRTTQLKLTASDGAIDDELGWSVSLDGDVALIGSSRDDDYGESSGSAYIYRFDGSRWTDTAKLTASDGSSWDNFGGAVSLSGDLALIGARGNGAAGAAYIFRWNGSNWLEEAKLLPPDGNDFDRFGESVSLDGDLALIGSDAAAFVFRWDGSQWQQEAILEANDGSSGYFCNSVSLSGDVAIVGTASDDDLGTESGSAVIFRWDGNSWQEEQKLLANNGRQNDWFGFSVSVSGDTAIVGTYRLCVAVYCNRFGSAYVYRFNGTSWVQEVELIPTNSSPADIFGFSVSVRDNLALIAAPGYLNHDFSDGAALLFRFNGTDWQEQAILNSDGMEVSVSLSDNLALVGIPYDEDYPNGDNIGAASLYNLSPGEVPDIDIEPSSFLARLIAGESLTESLTITNTGFQTLTWELAEEADWLKVMPISGTIATNQEQTVTLLFDATLLTDGTYTETLTMTSNDPDEGIIEMPATLRVMPPESKLLPSDGASSDSFGRAVSMSGDLAVIGAPYDNDNGNDSGSAYIYRWDGSSWQEEAKLTASDGFLQHYFGTSVSIHDEIVIIGAYGEGDHGSFSGSAYIFRFNGSSWQQEARLLADDAGMFGHFGYSVSISHNTHTGYDYAIVGSHGDNEFGFYSGAAYIFRFDGTTWQQESKLTASDAADHDYFGYSVSLDGETAIIGAYGDDDYGNYTGSAYIYRFDGTTWQQETKLTASDGASYDYFGSSVSLDGTVALIGAREDNAHAFGSGEAYIYRFDGTNWLEEAKLIASDRASSDYFGTSVSLEGDLALIGAYGDDDNGSSSGSAYLFAWDGTGWQEELKLLASDGASSDDFGYSVALSGKHLLVGALYDDNLLGKNVGAAYLYDLSPRIALSASSITSIATAGASGSTETLTMTNTGFYTLTWQLAEEADWLEVMPISGTIAVNQEQTVTLLFDATLLTDGTYTETLTITSNDPDEGIIELPITLLVTAPTPTHTPTSTPTATATSTPTASATATSTPTASATATSTSTASATATSTSTASATATSTPTASATATSTPTASATATSTPTASATATSTPTALSTVISTAIRTLTPGTQTPTATQTASSTPTASATATSTATATGIPTSTPTVTATPTVTPITSTMIDESGGTLTSPDGRVELEFPAGAVKQEISVIYTEQLTPSANTGSLHFANLSFDISAFESSGVPVSQFLQPLSMSISYQDSDWQAAGIEDESYLNLYWWDGQNWLGLLPCNGCQHDTQNNRLTIRLDHLSQFALLADEEAPSRRIYLPVISR